MDRSTLPDLRQTDIDHEIYHLECTLKIDRRIFQATKDKLSDMERTQFELENAKLENRILELKIKKFKV